MTKPQRFTAVAQKTRTVKFAGSMIQLYFDVELFFVSSNVREKTCRCGRKFFTGSNHVSFRSERETTATSAAASSTRWNAAQAGARRGYGGSRCRCEPARSQSRYCRARRRSKMTPSLTGPSRIDGACRARLMAAIPPS